MLTVIVGHGKSAEGKGWGPRIDAADRVVRMYDCHWQDEDDYGVKYDYGVFEIGGGLFKRWRKFNQRQPTTGWLASVVWHTDKGQYPPNTEIVDQIRWNNIGQEMGGVGETGRLQFQRGTIAACWAIETSQPGDTVLLMAFDNVFAGAALPREEGFPQAYLDEPSTFPFRGYIDGVSKAGNHDFAIEEPVMRALADPRGVKLTFSQREWT